MSDFKNGKKFKDDSFGETGKYDVQDMFLKRITDAHVSVTVFLMCGVRLQGIVTSFDKHTLLLKREGHTQLVFKHSVSTIMPSEPMQFFDDEKEEEKSEE